MRHMLLVSLAVAIAGTSAQAEFYPYYSGAAHMRQQASQQPLPSTVVPTRYYAPAYGATPVVPAPAPVAPAPVQTAYASPAPTYVAPQPAPAYVPPAPAYTPPPPQPAYVAAAPQYVAGVAPYTPPAYVAPAPAPITYQPAEPAYTPAAAYPTSYQDTTPPLRNNHFYLGVHGYFDEYKEPVVDLVNHGIYGGIDYGYSHYFTTHLFGSLQGRASYGQTDYKSISGNISRIPGYELDNRLLIGSDIHLGNARVFRPYLGLGARYYSEKAKGEVTDSSPPAVGYDRRIFQLYLPIGLTYEFQAMGYHMAPMLEFDPLFYGNVQSRFQNLGLPQATNIQDSGAGIRGSWMVGRQDAQGRGWQFGPYFNYWNVDDSKTADCDGPAAGTGFCVVEPENKRWQVGLTARWLF